ncbi:hypothetical protein QZH41_007733 [Actinostola sp. cb2023]|nr:hypothetical protein QZH41_007733 [Actinostola sp. cb2023]
MFYMISLKIAQEVKEEVKEVSTVHVLSDIIDCTGGQGSVEIAQEVKEHQHHQHKPPPHPPTGTQGPTPPPPTGTQGPTPPPPTGTQGPSTAQPPLPTTQAPPPPSGSCGIRPSTRIVGGVDAAHGGWPWQAMLRYATSGSQFCGGALVHPEWVVTASHCVDRLSAAQVHIRMGAHKRTSTVGTEQDFKVSKIIKHSSYQSPKSYSHDIALLKLERPALLDK